MSYSCPLSSSGKEEGEMHRRKGDVVVGNGKLEVVGNGKLESVAEETCTCMVS